MHTYCLIYPAPTIYCYTYVYVYRPHPLVLDSQLVWSSPGTSHTHLKRSYFLFSVALHYVLVFTMVWYIFSEIYVMLFSIYVWCLLVFVFLVMLIFTLPFPNKMVVEMFHFVRSGICYILSLLLPSKVHVCNQGFVDIHLHKDREESPEEKSGSLLYNSNPIRKLLLQNDFLWSRAVLTFILSWFYSESPKKAD